MLVDATEDFGAAAEAITENENIKIQNNKKFIRWIFYHVKTNLNRIITIILK